MAAEAAARRGDQVSREESVQEIENARIDVGFVLSGLADGPVQLAPIGIGRARPSRLHRCDKREAGDHLLDRPL